MSAPIGNLEKLGNGTAVFVDGFGKGYVRGILSCGLYVVEVPAVKGTVPAHPSALIPIAGELGPLHALSRDVGRA